MGTRRNNTKSKGVQTRQRTAQRHADALKTTVQQWTCRYTFPDGPEDDEEEGDEQGRASLWKQAVMAIKSRMVEHSFLWIPACNLWTDTTRIGTLGASSSNTNINTNALPAFNDDGLDLYCHEEVLLCC